MSSKHKNPTISFRITDAERKQIEARILASGMMKKDYFIRSCIYNRIYVVGKKETIFLMYSGNFGDHGRRSSRNERSVSSICAGISVRRYSKYSYGFKLLTLAVSAMLYIIADDVAPFIVSIISQFFLLCA